MCKMDSTEYETDICRICLEDNVLLDWNTSLYQFHDTTYKDCYFKYTQLECYENDHFPQMLCQNCCKALHSTHTLILTALESHKVLQGKFCFNSQLQEELRSPASNNGDSHYTPAEFETILVEEIKIEPILDEHFKYQGSSDEDISVAYKAAVIAEERTKGPIAEYENVKTKPKREQSVKTKNKFKEYFNEPANNSVEMNASSIKWERNNKPKVKRARTINNNDQNEMFIEHISEEEQIVECNSIDYNLMDGNEVEEEEETANVGPKTRKNYKHEARICSFCSKILCNKYKLERHERTHLKIRERKEICKVCGLKFYDQGNLYGHMLTHKENREKQHKCEFCSKAFYNKGALNVHRRIHLGQMVPCSLCSKQFYRQIDLDRHMNSHSAATINSDVKKKSKYFVRCPHCDKSILSTTFKAHTAAHLNEPLMKCSICDKEYFSRKGCVRHVKKQHQKTDEEYNDFIVKYPAKSRFSHLFLKQLADVQYNNE